MKSTNDILCSILTLLVTVYLQSRAKVTGRVVPEELLERTMSQVPKSIRLLQDSVEFAVEIENSGDSRDVEIKTDGLDWDGFKSRWVQSCYVDNKPLLMKDFA